MNSWSEISDLQFANPGFFWLLLLLPMMTAWYLWRMKIQDAAFQFSSLSLLGIKRSSPKSAFKHLAFVCRILGIAAMIAAIARPQSRSQWKDIKTEGIDIVLSLDVSYSMLAKDFKPNRIEAAKEVAVEFIDSRPNDRIGLVLFGGEAFTQCPLTTDHAVVKNLFSEVNAGMLGNGTAIGMGIADAVLRSKESKAKSKVIILLSDGVNNMGEITPLTAGEIAKTFGIRIYTIGVGTRGKALTPTGGIFPNGQIDYQYQDVEIDEASMTKIAEETGGKYFRATDNESLREVYKEIDLMEKSIISEKNFSNNQDCFLPFAIAAAIFLLSEFIIRNFLFNPIC